MQGWEWIVIGAVAIVLILWGPTKIPEFARSLVRARGEFARDFKGTVIPLEPARLVVQANAKTDLLYSTAQSLGIPVSGKSRSQISQDILQKVRELGEK